MSQDTLKALNEERHELGNRIQELADIQDKWNAEQAAEWDTVNARFDEVAEKITALMERQAVLEKLEQVKSFDDRVKAARSTEVGERRAQRVGLITAETRALALQGWMRRANDMPLDKRHAEAIAESGLQLEGKFLEVNLEQIVQLRGYGIWDTKGLPMWDRWDAARGSLEKRQLNVGTPAQGGYTVPEGFSYELERILLGFGGPRRVCRIYATASGNPLPWPVVDDTANEGEIVAEEGPIGSSVDPTFSQVLFGAFKYSSKPILITAELLEDSAFNMALVIAELLGERIGRKQAKDFTVGSGTGEPTGLVTGSTLGVTTASNSSIDSDEIIDLQYSLDPAYESLPSIGWMMNKKTQAAVRKLKDTTGQYLWQPSYQLGQPDLLLGRPIVTNQDMADIGASAAPMLYGAYEKYVIRDAAMVRFYRLEELYRANDHTGFIAFRRSDGNCLNGAAIKHMIMPA